MLLLSSRKVKGSKVTTRYLSLIPPSRNGHENEVAGELLLYTYLLFRRIQREERKGRLRRQGNCYQEATPCWSRLGSMDKIRVNIDQIMMGDQGIFPRLLKTSLETSTRTCQESRG